MMLYFILNVFRFQQKRSRPLKKLYFISCCLMILNNVVGTPMSTVNLSNGISTLKPSATTEMVYQRFAIEPQDQTAVIGSRVTLPCRVLDQKGPIQWTKDDFGLGAVRNLTGFERYAMIGSDEEGN